MNDLPREDLVVLRPRLVEQTLDQLRMIGKVTQVLSPRLALVLSEPEVRQRIAKLEGVIDVYSDTPPKLSNLTPAERVFISAWETRGSQKRRPGDQLSWGTPGFLAPDLPDDGDNGS